MAGVGVRGWGTVPVHHKWVTNVTMPPHHLQRPAGAGLETCVSSPGMFFFPLQVLIWLQVLRLAHHSQRKRTQAHHSPQKPTTVNAGPHRPTQTHNIQRRPCMPTTANPGQRSPAQAHDSQCRAYTDPWHPMKTTHAHDSQPGPMKPSTGPR